MDLPLLPYKVRIDKKHLRFSYRKTKSNNLYIIDVLKAVPIELISFLIQHFSTYIQNPLLES